MAFVVIEGLDGSGKSTQIKLLQEYLSDHKISYRYLHFPRTDSPVFGDLIARFLRGELGKINEVNPYLVALIYAGDRDDAKDMLNKWLQEVDLVLIDRYVFSNIAFQCAKLTDPDEQDKLKDWILDLEFEHNALPSPDLSLFLDVPFDFTVNKLTHSRNGDDRTYLNGKADIHEQNLDFQERVRQVYLSLTRTCNNFKLINCDSDGKMLPPSSIFQKMIEIMKKEFVL
jgi:dTMP kinase